MIKDEDILYVDYLGMFRRVNTSHPLNKVVEKNSITYNRKSYQENIKLIDEDTFIAEKSKKGIIEKYVWLKEYHNSKCKQLGYLDLIIE